MVTMKKKLTVLIFDATGTPVRQAAIPRLLLPVAAALGLALTFGLYWGISDYCRLKAKTRDAFQTQANLRLQEEMVAQQRDQLAAFAQKIDTLGKQLANLREFENKIRIIANLDPNDDGESMFGVGGSDPDDLDAESIIEIDYHEMVRDMHAQVNEISGHATVQQDSFASIFNQLEGKRNLLAATPSIRPVKGWITSRFGRRKSPFTGRREFHRGLDIATRHGSEIIAPADGIVTFSAKKGLMGNMVTIEHGFGMTTRYGHISKLLKKKGERIKRGEVIALVGNTGRSTGPHLHYEVRINGVNVNPMNYFLN
ncbi:peptidase M24 [Desulfosarcina ovata subsp. sediminis]|uniref:Peptidase M24 n=1 Tax=Desulfosarcina ovata subsp. sediminis TaxID=885957 RepID=A0A5K7ZMC2_9BACT|nr:M23 family metallopeptidase [Desulfosarcina ovata]BBO80759.1 peptidase M24 [Desulfosarcina ovata subsp. sediminis]